MIQLFLLAVFTARFGQKWSPEVFCKKGVLKNFVKFTGKHLFWRLSNVANIKPATLLKRGSNKDVFL